MKEESLLALLTARSPQAVAETQEEFGKYLYSIAYRVLKNPEDAQECVNDTLMKVWETIPPQVPKSLKAYVGTMARNVALDCYRKQKSGKRYGEFTELLEETAECVGENPETQVEMGEIGDYISQYLRSVSEEKRLLFVARYYHGYGLGEIAKTRQLSQGKVKMILLRMRNDLKDFLEEKGVWQ